MTTAPMRRSASNFAAAARSAVGSIVTTLPRLSAKMFLTNMVASWFQPPNPRCRLWATIRPEAGFRQETVQCEKKPFQGNAAVIWARNPFCRRMCCDIDPDRVSTLQPNDDQGIQQVEAIWSEQRADPSQQCPARGSAEKVPSLTWRSTPLDHVFGDARLRDLKPQLQQLAVDARRSPQWVLDAHLPDQRPQLRANLRPPGNTSSLISPVVTGAGLSIRRAPGSGYRLARHQTGRRSTADAQVVFALFPHRRLDRQIEKLIQRLFTKAPR